MSPSPPQEPFPDPTTIDELFELMGDEYRRRVLYCLREHDGTADVDELIERLAERTNSDSDEVSILLKHVALPKLDDRGVIEREPNGEIRYDGGKFTTELLEWIEDKEQTTY